ncbi:MAG: hypothetical protein ACJA16_001648 [Akkermansiaceae bacterium]|jgi:hypothetical protein
MIYFGREQILFNIPTHAIELGEMIGGEVA